MSAWQGALGLCAPDLHQGGDHPGPANGGIAQVEKIIMFRLPRWGYGKFEVLLAQESQRKSERESGLSPLGFSLTFPGCIASG